MKRLVILFCLLFAGFIALLLVNKQPNNITLLNGSAVQSSQNTQMFMVSLKVVNEGAPDRLISVASPSAQNISIMNPANDASPIVIPKDSTGLLAMDGAHIMLITNPDTFSQGAFIPVTLTFENAGTVSARVQNTGAAMMNHGQSNGVSEDPAPTLALSWTSEPNANGATLNLNTQNFTFTRTEDGAPHVPNQGHAHIYLNGLKLGRLYENTYALGSLSSGKYQISVALNTNDHRPYLANNDVVSETLTFEIEE